MKNEFLSKVLTERKQKKGIIMRTLIIVLVLLSLVFFNSSCNMLRGAGQDIGNAGDSIEDATN
jgi:predicted small secreted protein